MTACTAWYADDHGSAECERTDIHDQHRGIDDSAPWRTYVWSDSDEGAHPALEASAR